MSVSTCLGICAWTLLGAAASEALSWLFVYRRPEYKRLMESQKRETKRLEKLKETLEATALSKNKGRDKKLERMEKDVSVIGRDLHMMKACPIRRALRMCVLSCEHGVPSVVSALCMCD